MSNDYKDINPNEYVNDYSESGFWDKIKKNVKKIGSKLLYTALQLYYAAKSEDTPAWAKTTIYGALGYLILPIDLIPDALPVVGFSDDAGAIAAATAVVATYITQEVKNRAQSKMKDWFGEDEINKVC